MQGMCRKRALMRKARKVAIEAGPFGRIGSAPRLETLG